MAKITKSLVDYIAKVPNSEKLQNIAMLIFSKLVCERKKNLFEE
jgi:hypothetical protein